MTMILLTKASPQLKQSGEVWTYHVPLRRRTGILLIHPDGRHKRENISCFLMVAALVAKEIVFRTLGV